MLQSFSSPEKLWASIHIDGGVILSLVSNFLSSSVKLAFLLCAVAEANANKDKKSIRLKQNIFGGINLLLFMNDLKNYY